MGRASIFLPNGERADLLCRVQGERYFACRPNYGVFVRPDKLKVGDFPVEEINFDDEEM